MCSVKAWASSGSTLANSAQTEGNGVELGATFERVTTKTTRVKRGDSHRSVKTTTKAFYTCTKLNAPHGCTFEFTESEIRSEVVIGLTDAPTMFIHFAHQPSNHVDGSFDLAITFASTGEVQPLLCKILCLPCMLIGCIDMDRENRETVVAKADHMKQQVQQIVNGGPQAMSGSEKSLGEKSLGEKIKEINELKEQGVLSEEEFSAAKAKLLSGN